MGRVDERIRTALDALSTLDELLPGDADDDVQRDAAIQRFEYAFETTWKAAQGYLREVEGIDEGSPKSVVRACFRVGVLEEGEAELALGMVDDRNLTVHTYNEELAREIHRRLPDYAELNRAWLERMQEEVAA